MSQASQIPQTPTGSFTTLDGEAYYRIVGYDRMPSFLMSLPSDTDLWMFITSRGGLTAGRVDADGSLFPYETADKLADAHRHSGPITWIRVETPGGPVLWQPFDERADGDPRLERALYKNTVGNRLVFEEIHRDLGLAFRYRWTSCDRLGWVRTATLTNLGTAARTVHLLDGLRNVLPFGAPLALYQQSSSLIDAYKRTEVDPETGLGIFSLTASITDRAEAAEELHANTVWCRGLPSREVHLSLDAVTALRRGETHPPETVRTGRRGNYLVTSVLDLAPGAPVKWHLGADAGRSHTDIAQLRAFLQSKPDPADTIEACLDEARHTLRTYVAMADGLQLTGDAETTAHHFANTLFNIMRGGVFADQHTVAREDFLAFLETRNTEIVGRHRSRLAELPDRISVSGLLEAASTKADPDLERLCYEYLPLFFGRRHGDPSRPWNRVSIHVRNPDGSRALHYEGNWRDIFQNWEALGLSFPDFLPGILAKFVNASTVDGFNPYRITRDGFDWETDDPDDPWSYIGYWGDHQIIYLLKLLEWLPRFQPQALHDLLDREIFSYADVPYRLRPYADLLRDPHNTIFYDTERAAHIVARVRGKGTDGKLVHDSQGEIQHVTLLEKLLVPALSKLSNLVPDGGIWMNTQRPEWNDANNALAGNGLSMVTLYYLRRYMEYLRTLFEGRMTEAATLSTGVAGWMHEVENVLATHQALLESPTLDDAARKRVLDDLGAAFETYRIAAYAQGLPGKTSVPLARIRDLCTAALAFLDHAIRANKRDDGLYHAYNILEIIPDHAQAKVHSLYEMLEGQVAVLSSGFPDATEASAIIRHLFNSSLYREDQGSFLLYPARKLPGFLDRNVVPDDAVATTPLLRSLVEAGETSVIVRDAFGVARFHADFHNARDLETALDRLAEEPSWASAVKRDAPAVLELYESVFHHRAFTGRSGTMYGYEGLGCIYWHMVAKLLLAVQEILFRAETDGTDPGVLATLAADYYRIRAGLGFEKTAGEYGAFPTDPYSHTPPHAGAQQPGMTGQVKEELLTRLGELGVRVENGSVRFHPTLLRRSELLGEPATFDYVSVRGERGSLELPSGSLAFTLCQVPVVYTVSSNAEIRIATADGVRTTSGSRLSPDQARDLFSRSGRVTQIDVTIPENLLLEG